MNAIVRKGSKMIGLLTNVSTDPLRSGIRCLGNLLEGILMLLYNHKSLPMNKLQKILTQDSPHVKFELFPKKER